MNEGNNLRQKITNLENEIGDLRDELGKSKGLQDKIHNISTYIDINSESVFDESETNALFELCREQGIALNLAVTSYVHHVLSEIRKIIDAE